MAAQRPIKGRGTTATPKNRFESLRTDVDWEQLAADDELLVEPRQAATEFLPDKSESLIVENHSPDIAFRFGVNAYRGCEHGCAYCYARPYHEYLGMNAGLDFETKILVKYDAVRIFRRELNKPSWKGEWLHMSGVTDCYQPCERNFRLTRGLLEVMNEASQAVTIVTKNALVCRDIDILAQMAQRNLVQVGLSVTTLDAKLGRVLEPRTSSPEARLKAITALSSAGIPVRAMLAPMIPGLTDHELPQLMAAVKEAGAGTASYTLLRLPYAVAPIFQQWLAEHRPLALPKIEGLIRGARDGALYKSEFGSRMKGKGVYADNLKTTFNVFVKKLGLDRPLPELDCSQFSPPRDAAGQQRLF